MAMNRKEHLLQIVSEECAETAQRASKAARFSINEIQKGQNLTNAERLVYEFNDLLSVMMMLYREGYIPHPISVTAQEIKRLKVEEFLAYSKKIGTLVDDPCYDHPVDPDPKEEYMYEIYLDDSGPVSIHGWIPIAIDRIKRPDKIPYYLKIGLLRKIDENKSDPKVETVEVPY